jgi:putative ATP-dependent endonuclease of the OLD family
MQIDSIIVKNFKKFQSQEFSFNDKLNIIVGDNDSGKSTILECIELVVNGYYRGKSISSQLSPELFNSSATARYLASDKHCDDLPEIKIEAFMSGCAKYRGTNNSKTVDTDGISIRICFDTDLTDTYKEFMANGDAINTIPTEFYTVEWLDFAWNRVKYLNREAKSLLIDPTRLHPTYGKNQYISNIISSTLNKQEQALLSLNYRELKTSFNNQPQVKEINQQLDSDNKVTEQSLDIVADIAQNKTLESGLQLAVDDITFPLIGKGEQNKIQIKLALANKSKNINFIMVEEPENHLSHINLCKLIHAISEQATTQLFLTTHSSYVLNKLSLQNLCLLAEKYKQLKYIDSKVAKRLQRLPGYDTLRVVLSKKVILVEGPSDELILKKIYLNSHNRLPEEDGIDIIVVRGIGFKNYLEIAKHIGTKVHVVKDNDGDFDKNITKYGEKFDEFNNFMFSAEDDDLNSLEPAMIQENSRTEEKLNKYAKVALSKVTYNKYLEKDALDKKVEYLRKWYASDGKNHGSKKVDSAIRIFDSNVAIKYPTYLVKALNFD